ncbi:transketolase [Spirochaeta isovalerica]|uniref:Transketolase n=1 Tax=Spirochaeta isovalerica TaxID=150 RepID=A0A841R9W7_9SPIO|nr:transketolase [Spirochaeta isovalerica]MBB6480683.1 transketolase [Spirochaeta isovalerica]
MKTDKNARLAADTIRVLSAEAVQKANSGHPGMPMGCADFAYTLWKKHMRHNPADPAWIGRDRFVLSAGHGSMLLYSLLHLFDYGLSMEELQNFRQLGSLTPGHPEFGHTAGVDCTTGPLGSGFASAVGMAMAAKNFAARTGLDKSDLLKDQKVYVISGDGCMQEGTTSEAASLAGHLKLDNLIVFYDDNKITIEGNTDKAFTEDVAKRFEAYNWRVLHVENGNDLDQNDMALTAARKSDGRPTLIIGKTTIGFGAPNKGGSHKTHGEPLGVEELAATKEALGFSAEPFTVPAEVKTEISARIKELKEEAAAWNKDFEAYRKAESSRAALIDSLTGKTVPENLLEELLKAAPVEGAMATRASSGKILQKAAELIPSLMGGAADLAPSTKSDIQGETSFQAGSYEGRNFHFGVRELGMAMIANGMALYGVAIPYSSTFFVFSDYMKPAIRLAALQKLNQVYILTHDSFFVGEDGPTHEPIEQLPMLRTIPDMTVIRPADANEAAHAWNQAVRIQGPVALVLTRQNLAPLSSEQAAKIDMSRGAYILSEDAGFDMILIATGSEVNLALESAELLRKEGKKVRVVSMPSREIFERQDKAYRDSVLPSSCTKRVSIEAATTYGWGKYVGFDGLAIGIDHFGESAPAGVLQKKFGFVPEAVVEKIKKHFA